MIRISKPAEETPDILKKEGVAARQSLEALYDSGTRYFLSTAFDSSIYGHKQVKDKLISLQHDKCCFCEAKITHISYGDVEHFRPKAGWVQAEEAINPPGYYWLAYNWDNLFLSCTLCNQRYKKNYFPIANPASRALSHHDNIATEEPLFIHISNENPEDFITFINEIPVAINGNERGKQTIRRTGIDREKLNTNRRFYLQMVKDIYELAMDCPPVPETIKAKALAKIKEYYYDSQKDSTEYASMLRCFFKVNPIAAL